VERHGVPAARIPHASIARCTGSILPLTFGGFALRKWFRVLVPLQFLLAVASQFSSTLLFSDFDGVTLRSFPQSRSVNYTFLNSQELRSFKNTTGGRLEHPPDWDLENLASLTSHSLVQVFESPLATGQRSKRLQAGRCRQKVDGGLGGQTGVGLARGCAGRSVDQGGT